MTDNRPVVAIWRQKWLPRSETFILNHVTSLSRYQPLTLGLSHLRDGLDYVPDRAPLPATGPLSRLEGVSRRTGWLGLHDDLLVRQRPRLLHAHFGTDAVRALPLVRRHRLPLAVTFHGYDVQAAPNSIPAPLYRDRLPELFQQADLLLPVSHYLADRLEQLGAPRSKMRVHYLGIPTDSAPPPPRAQRCGIVMVGRIVDFKGHDKLVEVMQRLPEHLRSTPVTLVGGGPLEQALRDQVAAHPELDIRFAGWQTPSEVATSMASAEVFLTLSRATDAGVAEAFGLVSLEASLAGTPVVAWATGGIPEAVADGVTGLVAPADDTAAIAAHLATLLDDPHLARRMGEAGRRRVLADFDIARQTAQLEDMYDALG